MSKNKTVKIMAILALVGIVISVIGTGILVFTSNNNSQKKEVLTKEKLEQIIKQNEVKITSSSGVKN